ncbi:hypothetical protein F3Y30_10965 [Sinorhizobium sp. BG8]|nr:hypothetical protein F3Y30_10965 [Sinorhizobium sp. BG8]
MGATHAEPHQAVQTIEAEHLQHVKKVNDIFYDQVKISDQKAAYIFTFMLAFLVTSGEGRGVFTLSSYASESIADTLLSALLAVSLVVSIVSAILVVLPRRVNKATSLFWGAWPKHREAFRAAAAEGDTRYLFDQYLENADAMAMLAADKYRYVAFAFRGLLLTVLAYVGLLLTR